MYQLNPTLAADSHLIGYLPLCEVRLLNNASYHWLVLIPRRENVREIHELCREDQHTLIEECSWVSERLAQYCQADKINSAAFGNMVPQLHVHLIARHTTDPAWPNPVWLKPQAQPYLAHTLSEHLDALRTLLQLARPHN